jgi:FtsP/CotA-like multicopper oxidase with cupredoxin domain
MRKARRASHRVSFRWGACAQILALVLSLSSFALILPASSRAQDPPRTAAKTPDPACPRGREGGLVQQPATLRSHAGILKVNFTFRSGRDTNGHVLYCYFDERGNQAPTLRVYPGDTLILTVKNEISIPVAATSSSAHAPAGRHSSSLPRHFPHDPCGGGVMSQSVTNLHFHGMTVPPACHQDETLKTMLLPGASPFEYRIQIPKAQPPGLYWYHPHIHGFSEEQILGGASGALIVEGMEQAKPQAANLPERVLVVRDQKMAELSAAQKVDPKTPTKDLSVNFVPVRFPKYRPAVIRVAPSQRELWRVLNASADTYLDLQVLFDGKIQLLGLLALDGVPLQYDEQNSAGYVLWQTRVFLAPAGRAEFLLDGPPEGVKASLVTSAVPRGPSDEYNSPLPLGAASDARRAAAQDDNDPARPLASIVASARAPRLPFLPQAGSLVRPSAQPPLASVRPTRARLLYFSEQLVNPRDPASLTEFFITEEGQRPAVFDPNAAAPNIVVHQGDVEDWTIENRSQEPHAFHIHQTHFLVVGSRGGVPFEPPTLRDTINLPPWNGAPRPFPSVTLRVDFRDPAIVGTFPYHCHVLQHVDAGMMGTVRVDPLSSK